MAPEYGATCGYFPIDEETLRYMHLTNRSEETIALVEAYAELTISSTIQHTPRYTKVVELDLSTVIPSISGPKRPQDLISLSEAKQVFHDSITHETGVQGFGLDANEINKTATVTIDGAQYTMRTGHVAIAAITSCTNTSKPVWCLCLRVCFAPNAVQKGLARQSNRQDFPSSR